MLLTLPAPVKFVQLPGAEVKEALKQLAHPVTMSPESFTCKVACGLALVAVAWFPAPAATIPVHSDTDSRKNGDPVPAARVTVVQFVVTGAQATNTTMKSVPSVITCDGGDCAFDVE